MTKPEFPKSWVVVWNTIDEEKWLVRHYKGETIPLRKEHPGEFDGFASRVNKSPPGFHDAKLK